MHNVQCIIRNHDLPKWLWQNMLTFKMIFVLILHVNKLLPLSFEAYIFLILLVPNNNHPFPQGKNQCGIYMRTFLLIWHMVEQIMLKLMSLLIWYPAGALQGIQSPWRWSSCRKKALLQRIFFPAHFNLLLSFFLSLLPSALIGKASIQSAVRGCRHRESPPGVSRVFSPPYFDFEFYFRLMTPSQISSMLTLKSWSACLSYEKGHFSDTKLGRCWWVFTWWYGRCRNIPHQEYWPHQ